MLVCQSKWDKWATQVEEEAGKLAIEIDQLLQEESGVEMSLERWNAIMTGAADKELSSGEHARESNYTIRLRESEELRLLKEKERELRHKYNTKLHQDKTNVINAKKAVQKKTKEICNEIHQSEWNKLASKIRDNPSHIYKILRKTGKKAKRVNVRPHIVKKDGSVTSGEKEVKEGFHKAWEKIYQSRSANKELPEWLKGISNKEYEPYLHREISTAEVVGKISHLSKGKAAGADNIHNEFLYHMPKSQGEILVKILNEVNRTRMIPETWRESKTAMLYKGKGEKSEPENYRPIALLSCVYKVYSSIMTDRLNKWIEDNDILHKNQYGFRKGQDTADAAARIFACISNANSTNKALHLVLLDIAKAYDSVELWAMRQTLEAYHLNTEDIDIIMNILEGNSTKLLTAFGPTDPIEIKSGVRQGDVISPILFSLFINPLLEWLEKGTDPYRIGNDLFYGQAFADDTALLASSRKGIEERMKRVNDFMEHNNIKLNEDKSYYMWNRDRAAIIETKGRRVKYEGEAGWFTSTLR